MVFRNCGWRDWLIDDVLESYAFKFPTVLGHFGFIVRVEYRTLGIVLSKLLSHVILEIPAKNNLCCWQYFTHPSCSLSWNFAFFRIEWTQFWWICLFICWDKCTSLCLSQINDVGPWPTMAPFSSKSFFSNYFCRSNKSSILSRFNIMLSLYIFF